MKKLTIDGETLNFLRDLREKLGRVIPGEKMSKIVGGCGGVCKVTCSYWCSPIGTGQTDDREEPE